MQKILNINNLILSMICVLFYIKFGGSFFSFIPMPVYMAIVLILIFYTSNFKLFNINYWFVLLMIFLFNMFLSLIWTNAINYGTQKVFYTLFTIIFFYIIHNQISANFKRFLEINILFFGLFIINLIYEYGFFSDLTDVLNVKFRLGWDDNGLALNPIGVSRYIYYGVISCFFYFLIFKNTILIRSILITISVIGISYSILTGTKTPILAFFLALTLYFSINKFFFTKKLKTRILMLGAFLVIIFSQTNFFTDDGFTSGQIDFFQSRFLDSKSAIGDRLFQNSRALKKIDYNNFLLGSGSGNFGYVYTSKDERDYPHNIISEVLFENGLLNLMLLIFLTYYVLKKIRYNKSKELGFFIIAYLYFFVNSLFSGDLITNNLVFGFAILLITEIYKKKHTLIRYQIKS